MGRRTQEKLTNEVRTFVVRSLAMFDTPSIVAAAVKKEFGVDISRQSIESYDPTKRAGERLAERWKTLFEETRKSFLEDSAKVATTHRLVRVRRLERMADKAEAAGNSGLARELLEQIAKEMGDAYSNKQRLEMTGKGGGAIKSESTIVSMTAEAAYKRMLEGQ